MPQAPGTPDEIFAPLRDNSSGSANIKKAQQQQQEQEEAQPEWVEPTE